MKLTALASILLITFLICIFSCKNFSTNFVGFLVDNDSTITSLPAPLGTISDYEKILTVEEIRSLDSIILQFEEKSKININIVTTSSATPLDDLMDYAINLKNNWENNSSEEMILIIYSEKLKDTQVVANNKLKRKLTKQKCKKINRIALKEMKKGNNYRAINKALYLTIEAFE